MSKQSHFPTVAPRRRIHTTVGSVRRLLVLLFCVALVAVACGSSTSGGEAEVGVASIAEADSRAVADPDSSNDSTTGGEELEAPEDQELAFALYEDCLEDQGISFGGPVGGPGGDGSVSVEAIELEPGQDPQDLDFDALNADFAAAEEQCRGHLANLDIDFEMSPEQEAQFADAQLEFSKCMGELGIDVPDFDAGVGSIVIGGADESDPQGGGFGGADFDFEAFEDAASQCEAAFENIEGFGAPEEGGVMKRRRFLTLAGGTLGLGVAGAVARNDPSSGQVNDASVGDTAATASPRPTATVTLGDLGDRARVQSRYQLRRPLDARYDSERHGDQESRCRDRGWVRRRARARRRSAGVSGRRSDAALP